LKQQSILLAEDNEDDVEVTSQVLDRVRQDPRTQYSPVGILTASAEQDDVIGDLNANSYVRKPVRLRDTFVEAARQPGLYWTGAQRAEFCDAVIRL
jgi:CheY-like chemotaxis protein